jgi:drug/metabolite transporter (DMT)-like permease
MAAVGAGSRFLRRWSRRRSRADPVRGNLMAVASGFFWAITVCGLRWMGAGDAHGSAIPRWCRATSAFLVALPFAPVGLLDGRLGIVAYLGIFQIALAYLFVTQALV